jgi:hypothetical protein
VWTPKRAVAGAPTQEESGGRKSTSTTRRFKSALVSRGRDMGTPRLNTGAPFGNMFATNLRAAQRARGLGVSQASPRRIHRADTKDWNLWGHLSRPTAIPPRKWIHTSNQ